jgi:hypothetical protein
VHDDACDQPISGHSDGETAISGLAASSGSEQGRVGLEDLTLEPTICFLPEYDTEQEAYGYNGWFEYSFHSVLVDLCDDPTMSDKLKSAMQACRQRQYESTFWTLRDPQIWPLPRTSA